MWRISGTEKANSANKKLLNEVLRKRSSVQDLRYNNFQYIENQQLPHVSLSEKAWNRYFCLEKKAILFCLFYLICISSRLLLVLYSDFCEFSLLYRGDLLYRGGIKGYILIDNRIFLPYISTRRGEGVVYLF